MGGKRPDQYRIAPDETQATDYKTLPNEPDDLSAERRRRKSRADPLQGEDFEDLDKRVLKGNKKPQIDKEEQEG